MRRWVRTAVAVVAVLAVTGTPTASAESDRIAVEGVVVDDLTGEPLAGITVVGEHLIASEPSPGDIGVVNASEFDRDLTDEQGRYQLEGATLADSSASQVTAIDDADRSFRHLERTLQLPSDNGRQPDTTIAVAQSGTVRGRVTDHESGGPIAGVSVFAAPSGTRASTRVDGSARRRRASSGSRGVTATRRPPASSASSPPTPSAGCGW